MAKRKTKAEREAEAKAALKLRLEDMWCAADGEWIDPDDKDMVDELCADPAVLGRFINAIEMRFGIPRGDWTTCTRSFDQYDNMGKIVDMLWRRGVRADAVLESEAASG